MIAAPFRLLGKRFVFDHHDLAPETYLSRFGVTRKGPAYAVLQWLEKCSYAVANVVVATNESYRRTAIDRGRKRPETVFVVRNGPPLDYGDVALHRRPARPAAHCIGYVGTIGPQDGLDHWLQAIHQMVHTFAQREFVAIIIGDGDALPRTKTLAKELGIERYVLFTGRLSDSQTREYLACADLCVQPDPMSPLNDKSTMNKLMEYMALGKATVAFDLLETRVSAGDAAVYVPPNDAVEFARQVCRLLQDPVECRRMGEVGRTRVRDELAWEYSIPHLLRAYAALRP